MLLYHGTTKPSAQKIYRGIDLRASQGRLDFGRGFYMTADKGQAKAWARRKAFPTGIPAIIVFEADLSSVSTIYYESMSTDWAEEIYKQRVLAQDHFDTDCIIGPIADRRVREDALDCEEGRLSKSDFIMNISEKTLGMQYVFKTESSLLCLKFLKMEVLNHGS